MQPQQTPRDKSFVEAHPIDRTFQYFVISTTTLVIVLLIFILFPIYKLADGTRVHQPVWAPPAMRSIEPELLKSLEPAQRAAIEATVQPTTAKPEWLAAEKTGIRRRKIPTNPLFWVLIGSGIAWFLLQKRLGVF